MSIANVNHVQVPSLWEVAEERIQDPKGAQELVLKPIIQALDWVRWGKGGALSETEDSARNGVKRVDRFFDWLQLPKKTVRLVESVQALRELPSSSVIESADKVTSVFTDFTAVLVVLLDAVYLAASDGWVFLSRATLDILATVGFVCYAGLFVFTVKEIGSIVKKLMHLEAGDPKRGYLWIRLMTNIALCAWAAFGMIAYTHGPAMIALWLVLAAKTIYLVGCIASHFYEKIQVEPYLKQPKNDCSFA